MWRAVSSWCKLYSGRSHYFNLKHLGTLAQHAMRPCRSCILPAASVTIVHGTELLPLLLCFVRTAWEEALAYAIRPQLKAGHASQAPRSSVCLSNILSVNYLSA